MIAWSPAIEAILWVAASVALRFVTDRQRARRVATGFAIVITAVAAIGSGLESLVDLSGIVSLIPDVQALPPGLLHFAPAVTCLVGLLAVALGPIETHSPRTLSRIALLIATALGFLAIPHPASLSLMWLISAHVVWSELKNLDGPDRTERLFATYHAPSAILFALGPILIGSGAQFAGATVLIIAISIRESIFPLHSWFPRFVQRAPMGIVVAFAAPQLGVYAHLELLLGGIPEALAHWVAPFAAVTAVLAAGMGVAQLDARRALAYLIISQTGLVAFGLENESEVAISGAVLTWQVLALATSGFAMTLAALEGRRGKLSLKAPGGNFARTPKLAVAFLFFGLASVGFPLTMGFVAEDLLVQGSIDSFPLLALVLIVATALNGMTIMKAFFLLFSGRETHAGERDLCPRELWIVTAVIAMLLVGGLLPSLALH